MTDTALTLTRHLATSPASVWRCWSEPDLLRQWFAPRPVETTVAELDPRPGGTFRTVMVVPEHGEMAPPAGCILVAEPGARLVWTNCLGPDFVPNVTGTGPMDFGFTAEITMVAEAGGCRYTATVRHATPQDMQKHADMGFHEGWGAATTQLEALAGRL